MRLPGVRAWLLDAIGTEPIRSVPVRRALAALLVVAAAVFGTLALLRWHTFHNRTFDLAFYARMAWGEVHLDGWNPVVGANARGLHLSWILVPLGALGALFGQVPTLLVAQALAMAAAAWPLGRIGARHLGPRGAVLAALAWLLHPNLAHVAASEFHPGSVAALPLSWLADALDRRSSRGVLLAVLGVLSCREDLGLVTMLAGLAAAWLGRRDGSASLLRTGLAVAAGSLAYVAFFALVLHPLLAPPAGSLSLHFGSRGASVTGVLLHLVTHPAELAAHLAVPHRLLYLPLVCAPLGLLPFVRPAMLLVASPVLAVNLLSEFPGTTDLDSHYLTPALPFLVAGAVQGAAALPDTALLRLAPLGLCSLLSHVAVGGTPLSLGFSADSYRSDANTEGARRIVARIGPDASVQAPDPLLSHLAERTDVRRAPPPEAGTRFVALDLTHRRTFLHDEDLLRTTEEPLARSWLARTDHALVAVGGDYALLERGRDPREGLGAQAIVGQASPDQGRRLCACLSLLGAAVEPAATGELLVLDLVARGPCPDDLALRIGRGERPRRVDLLADGWLSPAHLRAGDRVRSVHAVRRDERRGLRVGALRSSGARPEHQDPNSIPVDLDHPAVGGAPGGTGGPPSPAP